MAKAMHCSDMGSDCTFVARGETVDEVMTVRAVHGKEVHGIDEITPEMAEQIKTLIRDE